MGFWKTTAAIALGTALAGTVAFGIAKISGALGVRIPG